MVWVDDRTLKRRVEKQGKEWAKKAQIIQSKYRWKELEQVMRDDLARKDTLIENSVYEHRFESGQNSRFIKW